MDRIKVAVIGCTGVGRLHAQGTVGVEGAELVAGCDLVPEVLEELKKACEGCGFDYQLITGPETISEALAKLLAQRARRRKAAARNG